MEFEGNNGEVTPPPPASQPVENQPTPPPSPPPQHAQPVTAVRNNSFRGTYFECQKNHASAMGGHSVDGCTEFLPAGPEGSIEAFNCAACNCHRNFHRKEIITTTATILTAEPLPPFNTIRHHPPPPPPPPPPQQYTACYRTPSGYLHLTTPTGGPTPTAFALPSPAGGVGVVHMAMQDHNGYVLQPVNGGVGGSNSNVKEKRFRTKFTAEQKEKMLSFAEKLDWRMQKQDEADIVQFCNETGVNRHVFKVWMHNNKHTLGKKP